MIQAGRKAVPAKFMYGLLAWGILVGAPGARAIDQTEVARIEALLQAVKTSGVSFIRNGEAYSAAQAAEHLKSKWEKGARYVNSAEDFIDNIASRSSVSGKPYLVVLPDGRKLAAAVWLRGLLKAADAQPRPAPPPPS